MNRILVFVLGLALPASGAAAERKVTLISNEALEAIRGEVLGATAIASVRELAQMHRVQASLGYREAAEAIQAHALAYGLSDVRIERLPADAWFASRNDPALSESRGSGGDRSPRVRETVTIRGGAPPWDRRGSPAPPG
jgi:hypothetical protein